MKVCPACFEKCTALYEVLFGGYQRIFVCARCKRAHAAYEKEIEKRQEKTA